MPRDWAARVTRSISRLRIMQVSAPPSSPRRFGGDADVLEGEGGGGGGAHTHFALFAAGGEAGAVGLDEEGADVAARLAGAGVDRKTEAWEPLVIHCLEPFRM
jgi:hypothetical protein